ncbi:MAG: alpha/beta hydrolase fold protein [Polyangiaceae bacterium]|nr:alpha/beta hydrolase fold protein [Polyangiaceae bacterium]
MALACLQATLQTTSMAKEPRADAHQVKHRRVNVAGVSCFYREAGPAEAPLLLLPHGYPCSSYEFRNFMPALADRWRSLAPDFPGSGYSDTAPGFRHDFDGYAEFLERFVDGLGVERFALYLHDFGSQIGLRLAMRHPDRVVALIIQNGDIYEDQLGPKYEPLQRYFRHPTPEARAALGAAVTESGFQEEFQNDLGPELAELLPPDLWKLHWSLMNTERRAIAIDVIAGLKENLAWFPRYQQFLREQRPPTLILWGAHDGYMPEGAARAYLRDLPEAELHLMDGGHWLLETHLHEVVMRTRAFLERVSFAR